MFKKFIGVLLLILTCFMFVACSKNEEEGGKTKTNNPTSTEKDPTQGSNPGGKTRKTVITYCNWNFGTEEENNLTRRRVE